MSNGLSPSGPAYSMPGWPASPAATRPVIQDVDVRELEETAKANGSWPARMVYAWPLFTLTWAVAAVTVSRYFGDWMAVVVAAIPALYLASALFGYMLLADRAYTRAWEHAASPEPGRLARRISQGCAAALGLCVLAIALAASLWDRSRLPIADVAGYAFLGFGAISTFSAFAWSHARAPRVWQAWMGDAPEEIASVVMGEFGKAYAGGIQGCYEPASTWTCDDDPKLVAWARALRTVWRSGWIVAAPARTLVRLLGGPMARVAAFRPGLSGAVAGLATMLGGTVKSYDEPAILDWLDAQGWGPAPHVPGVWLGLRWTVRGSFRGCPVAVSVVHRLGGSTAPTDRIDIFVAARPTASNRPVMPGLPIPMYGYAAHPTAWGTVFSRSIVTAEALSPALVGHLLHWALAAAGNGPAPQPLGASTPLR